MIFQKPANYTINHTVKLSRDEILLGYLAKYWNRNQMAGLENEERSEEPMIYDLSCKMRPYL